MKKTHLFIFALTFLSITIFAQNRQIVVGKNYTDKNHVTFVDEKQKSATLKFDMNELNLIEVETEYGKMYKMESGKAPLMLEAGNPELVYLPTAIIIPETGSTELQFTYGAYTDIQNVDIAPSKGNFSRSIDPATVPYQKGDVYQVNAFFPEIPAVANEPFIMRDVRGQSIFAYPVQYNPVTKTLRIYSEITVTAIFNDTPGINEFTTQKRHATLDPTFQDMYNNLFINNGSLNRDFPTGEDGELLIICHPAFEDAMKPYVNWKRTMGRKTTMTTTALTGTGATTIKDYITNYYNNPANNLAYVLLVGDFDQVAAHTYPNSGAQPSAPDPTVVSDNYYGQLVGGDLYMEILIGRMSAENIAHVQTQVQRAIHYERDLNTTDTWVSAAIGIATNEGNGGHDGGEVDYVHMNNIRNRLLNYGYNPVYQEYGYNSGVPNTSVTQITQRFNSGVSIANYCNHGSQTAWTLTTGPGGGYLSFSTSQVAALQNAGKLPFIFSVACLNGRFNFAQPCFAEAWLRSTQNGQPTGAVATLMATISLSWAPTMTAQDEFVNICMDLPSPYGGTQAGTKRTFAGAAINATQKMLIMHGATSVAVKEDFDAWTVFGDPTLMIRTKTPQAMTVSHFPVLLMGLSTFPVECDAEGALAVLTRIDENEEVIILGKGVVAGGTVEIILDEPASIAEDLTLTITAKNKVTHQSIVAVNPTNQPYLVMPSYKIAGTPDFGNTVNVNFNLNNISAAPYNAHNVVVKATTASPFVSITEPTINLGNIQAGEIYSSENELHVAIAENVPNNELIVLNLLITCEYETETYQWETTVKFNAYAPVLDITEIYIENLNGVRLDQFVANADNNLVVVFTNSGSVNLHNTNVAVSIASQYMSMPNNALFVETIEKNKTTTVKFLVKTGSAPAGTPVSMVVRASSGVFLDDMVYINSIGAMPAFFISNETITTAIANFYDSGGPNNPYSSSENLKITFLPANANKNLGVKFMAFNVEENTDYLNIYNGTTASSATQIASLTGSELPQVYEASNSDGALTFVFKSNAMTQLAGWAAMIYETEKYHNVLFAIKDENNQPVTDATITFDGYVLAKNQFILPVVAAGTYKYSVAKTGYPTISGTVTVENGDELVSVQLSLASINNNSLVNFYAYPNPFNDIIHIGGEAATDHKVVKVHIDNMLGQRIKVIDLQGKSSFSTENIPAGIYFITLEREDKETKTVKMIK